MTTVFLVASDHDTRGELILSALHRGGEPAVPYGDTVGIRHPAPPDAARADVVAALDAVDPDWPTFVAML
jgi:hypothetical protein